MSLPLDPTAVAAVRLPRIAVVVPVHNEEATLAACLRAVMERTRYPDWELVVVDDGSTDQTATVLRQFPDVRVLRQERAGVAAALNAAFAATGEADIVRLHADVLIDTPDWLSRLAEAMIERPAAGVMGARLVYPDGRIQSEGRSVVSGVGMHPLHRDRNAFAVESAGGAIREVDSVSGALAYYRRAAIRAVGGLDAAFGPAWMDDDDFCIGARFHRFKVFVHTGITGVHHSRCWAPTSLNPVSEAESILRAVTWQSREAALKVKAPLWEKKWGWDPYQPDLNEIRRLYGHTEICWQIGEPMRYRPSSEFPTVDCCLVTWNTLPLLRRCLESLAKTDYPQDRVRVYIADNASTDGTGEYLKALQKDYQFPIEVSRLEVNTGAAVGLNWAVSQGKGDLVARLDDDIILPANWLKGMVQDFVRRPFAGCIGPKILNDDAHRSIQCGPYRHFPGLFGHEDEADLGQADYLARAIHVRGCCNLYRRDVFARCGLFDVRYSPSQFDDPDHHIALAVAGYEILYEGRVGIVHKLNNGLARSRAAISNQQGNGGKMYGKWGSDIFEVLERSLELSREGRCLPDDGDTAALRIGAPAPADFPRSLPTPTPAAMAPARSVYDDLARLTGSAELAALVEEFLKVAAALSRDGKPRHAADILHSIFNFAPGNLAACRALARVYGDLGQPTTAAAVSRRGLLLHAGDPELLQSISAPPAEGVHGAAVQAGRPNDRSDHIGEDQVSMAQRRAGQSTPRLRVLMVNSFESRVAGGDMHQIKKTRQYLLELGVEVDVCCTPRPDPRGYDLVHVWNLWFPHQTLPQIKAIRSLAPDVPIVLSTIYWDMSEKAWADAAVPHLFSATQPEAIEQGLSQLVHDRLLVNGRRRSHPAEPNYNGYEAYQRQILERVDHLLPQSELEMANLRKTLGVSLPHTVVYNAAETRVFDTATADWFVDTYKVRDFVLTVGLVEPRKNQLMLLHALRDAGLPVVVVGRNYDRNYLRLCQRQAPRGTLFIEHLSHEKLASAYRAARVHALPSWMECAAFVNIEAALSGCSLAVSNRTSEREYFGDNAYYCDPADTASIRDAVVQAHRNHAADSAKRARLGDLFRHTHTWRAAAEQTLAGYEKALAARGRTLRPAVTVLDELPVATAAETSISPTRDAAASVRVSIVIPVFNRLDLTRNCLKAIEAHTPAGTYEVIVVDNGSTDGTAEFLESQSAEHAWLKRCPNPENRGFAAACNQGAAAARGREVLFLNNDTEPRDGWLENLLKVLDGDATVVAVGSKLLFPDETVQHAGVALFDDRQQPDPLLARHIYYRRRSDDPAVNAATEYQALTAACLVIRRSAFDAAGGFDEGYWNGYEDIDLCLRLGATGGRLVYQPKSVVVHHESQSGPERFRAAAANVARLHARWVGRVQPDFITEKDGSLRVAPTSRIRPYVPETAMPAPKVSLIILVHNQLDHTRRCLESVARHTPESHEVILVDNGSGPETAAYLRERAGTGPGVRLIVNVNNRGFSAGNNQGLAIARGEYVMLLNNDTVVTEGWLTRMLAVFERHPATGIVGPVSNRVAGPQLVTPVGYTDLEGLATFAAEWSATHAERSEKLSRVIGFCLLASRAVIDRVGGLDDRFGSGNFEDDDFCLRAGVAGFEIRIARDSFVHHVGGQTFLGAGIDYSASMRRNWEIFRRKWALPAELPGEKGYPVPRRMADGERLKIELSDSATIGEASSGSESRTSSGSVVVASMGTLDQALACREDGRPVEAWEAAIEAIRQRPFHPEAYLLMANVARTAGDDVAAVRAHKRAAALAPGCPAVKQLGQALKSKKELRKTDLRWPALPEASAEPKLSVCLIVKNEERFLARCLKSVREIASQIVVVDTGSTDRTVEIAREHNAEVHSFTWCDDFSAARNLSLLHARGDWVLILDADEELSGTHVQKLKSHLRTPGVLGFRLPLKESTLGDGALAYVPRLFRNAPGIYFIGRVHEEAFSQVERLGKSWGMEHRRGDALLIHHGYAPEVVAERNKKSRNLRLLRLGIAEHPQNLNYRTQLGLELVRSGDREAGLREYARALAQANAAVHGSLTPEAREALLTQYSTYLLQAGRWPEVVEVLRSPLAASGRLTAGQLLNRGTALIRMRCHADAARDLREAIARAGETTLYYRPEELSGPLPYLALGQALEGCGEIDAADQAYRTVIAKDPDSEEWVREYARFLTGQERQGDALRMLFDFALRRPDCLGIWQRGAEIALLRPELAGIAEQWCTEARRHHPNDPDLAIAEGAALLQRGRVKEAARALASAPQRMDAPVTAARLMTSLVADEPLPLVAGDQRLAVSRAFLETCQRLYQAGAQDTVNSVMQRVDRLRPVLPVVADALEGAADSAAR